MFSHWREAWFWTKAMAGVWLFAVVLLHGGDIAGMARQWLSGEGPDAGRALALLRGGASAPVSRGAGGGAPAAGTVVNEPICRPAVVPAREAGDAKVVQGFTFGADGRVDPEQYMNPATGRPFSVVEVAATSASFAPGTYYHLPEEIVFIPDLLRSVNDSPPYVSAALYVALEQLDCVVAQDNGEVRVNKALMPLVWQQYWEAERDVPARGLGANAVHAQIIDNRAGNQTPWADDLVVAALKKVNLSAPAADGYRAYFQLANPLAR